MPDAISPLLVSVIIDNYNYGRFLSEAIDSALAQTYPHVEVIVVDDGSTDNSREILATYGDRIKTILKPNGGQPSAFNTGYRASRGDVVIFLDADDSLLSTAAEHVINAFGERRVVKVHWPLWIIDSHGARNGETKPAVMPSEGDLARLVLERGPSNCPSPPTSGNAFARSFLDKVMPVPENVPYYRLGADEYLYSCAPAFGFVRSIRVPQGCYRIHGQNQYSAKPYAEQIQFELEGYDQQCEVLESVLTRNGFEVDSSAWIHHSWFHRLARGIDEIRRLIPAGERFVLIDDQTWNPKSVLGNSVAPFVEQGGVDYGPPADDHEAVAKLTQHCQAGLKFLVIAWPAFWWLEQFPQFRDQLFFHSARTWASLDIQFFELRIAADRNTTQESVRTAPRRLASGNAFP